MKKLLTYSAALLLSYVTNAQSDSSQHLKLLVGTYTSGNSKGIYTVDFDLKTGRPEIDKSTFTENPSYLAISQGNKFVYTVNEDGSKNGSGKVTSFSYNNGVLTKINTVGTGGDDPCYVSIDKTGKWLVAGNYSGGNFSVFPINADGSIGNSISTTNHSGSSANKERQEKAHVHCTIFSADNKYLLVADLGTDQIITYKFNEKDGGLEKPSATNVQPGAGPRHLTFSPDNKYVYLVEELFGNVDVYKYKKGKLKKQQTISMVPQKFMGKIGAADIHISPDGRFLYTSNRGESDMLTIFSIDNDGKLKVAGYQEVMGAGPRNFVIDPTGNFLLVANQQTDEIVVFRRDKYTGLLTDTKERLRVPAPVCLKWIR